MVHWLQTLQLDSYHFAHYIALDYMQPLLFALIIALRNKIRRTFRAGVESICCAKISNEILRSHGKYQEAREVNQSQESRPVELQVFYRKKFLQEYFQMKVLKLNFIVMQACTSLVSENMSCEESEKLFHLQICPIDLDDMQGFDTIKKQKYTQVEFLWDISYLPISL